MQLIIQNFYKCKILYYILFFCIFSGTCFMTDLLNYESRDESGPLFEQNQMWSPGDIPLLNRKIFRGMRVTIREHPYVASIRRNIMHYCVATMLTKNLFLTVAHPLIDVPLDELTVVVGENYADRGASLLTVILLIIHEDFDRYTMEADIALVRIYEDVPYRCSVKSIQLIHPKASLHGQRAFVTGWGRCDRTGRELCLPRSGKYTPGEKFDPMLRTVSFTINDPNYYCEGYKRNNVQLLGGMLCLGHAREAIKIAACLAVPGAPLVVNGHLVGIQSWGYGCGYYNDLPLIYTSMQYFQPWLLRNIPLLRLVPKKALTTLFETKRAYILSKWFMKTRIIPPEPFAISDKNMETLPLDKELAMLRGNIYDIRDFIFNGTHHKNKMKIYEKLRRKINEKEYYSTLDLNTQTLSAFLNSNVTKKPNKTKNINIIGMEFVDEMDRDESDSDKSYGEYNNEYAV